MKPVAHLKTWLPGVVALLLVLAVACGVAAPATAPPTNAPAATTAPRATSVPAVTGASVPTATVAPAATSPAIRPVSAKDNITLVIDSEPAVVNPLDPLGSGLVTAMIKDNLVEPLTWQSGDDRRIVPTTASESWQQLAPDKWRFQLRKGVKFVNGEVWNAPAALPTAAYQGVGNNSNSSFPYTGGFKAAAVDEYTLDINCDQACPILPNTSFFFNFEAPKFYTSASETDLTQKVVGFGPYKLVKWDHGVSLTEEAYDDYVPVGNHFEFQKPYIRNVRWLWRGESTVQAAMVQAGEADVAWDVGVDSVKALPKEMVRSGSSGESFILRPTLLWHPELKKKKVREAIVHAINCREIVDNLYGGYTRCLGNIIWPGVIGATEQNTAPYTYDPALSRQLLKEANYNPNNVITISGRGTRIPKQVEVYEAIQGYLAAVGMNVKVKVVESSIHRNMRACGIGQAVNDVLLAQGKDPKTAKPTLADMQAAIDKGGASCPTGDLMEDEPSNETLDLGRQINFYMNCIRLQSQFCDPSPGGIQEQIGPALSAAGAERQRLLQAIADWHKENVVHIPGFELPVFYAVNPKLNWTPRADRRVKVNSMWFSK